VLTLDIAGKEALALPKAIEIHPSGARSRHVDLIIVRRGEKVTVEVNVVVEGEQAGHPGQPGVQPTIESEPFDPEHLTFRSRRRVRTQFLASQVPLPTASR